MSIGPLYLGFFRISWHWPWSLTWRWIFDVKRHNQSVRLGFHKTQTHQGTCWLIVLNTRLLDFVFQSQPNMFHHKIRESKVDKWIEDVLK